MLAHPLLERKVKSLQSLYAPGRHWGKVDTTRRWSSGQLHAPDALLLAKEPAFPTDCEGGWALEPVWTF